MMMREILLDTLIAYRQEGENVLIIVAPAAVLGPIGAIIAGASVPGAVIAVPFLVLIYLAAFCACIRGASFIQTNLAPEPGDSYLEIVPQARNILVLTGPTAAMLAVILTAAAVATEMATAWVGVPLALLGGIAVVLWWAKHAYELPLLITHELSADDATTAARELTSRYPSWTLSLVCALAAPLVVALFLAWGLSLAIGQAFGAAFFAIALACWLPLPAFALCDVCTRLVNAAVDQQDHAPARAHAS
jgi:hypothetical protein